MELSEIKSYLLTLLIVERARFIKEMQEAGDNATTVHHCQQARREVLNNKQGVCPHCGHIKYVKFGSKSGSQRSKCKSFNRSFTEYTGTWMAGIHHKDMIDEYLELMTEEKSLDKKIEVGI